MTPCAGALWCAAHARYRHLCDAERATRPPEDGLERCDGCGRDFPPRELLARLCRACR